MSKVETEKGGNASKAERAKPTEDRIRELAEHGVTERSHVAGLLRVREGAADGPDSL